MKLGVNFYCCAPIIRINNPERFVLHKQYYPFLEQPQLAYHGEYGLLFVSLSTLTCRQGGGDRYPYPKFVWSPAGMFPVFTLTIGHPQRRLAHRWLVGTALELEI